MAKVFERFVKRAPVAVMARASLEYALEPAPLDELFGVHAERQYERKLLFSTMLDLTALVVCGVHPSVHAAYKAMREQVPVSLTAVYDKLGGVEPRTTEALVAHSAGRLRNVIAALGPTEPWLPGYRIRVLDGNRLAATERRLAVLRGSSAGPLPGQSLVVLEPEVGLVVLHAARSVHDGMDLMLDEDTWEPIHAMTPRAFAKRLVEWGKHADWQRFRKAVRGPKKPVTERTRFKGQPHVSTARLLAE